MRTEKEHPMITAGMLIDWIEPLAEKKQNRRFKPKAIRWISILPPHENEWEGLFEPNVLAASNNPESVLALNPATAALLVCEDIEALPESFDRENLLIVQTKLSLEAFVAQLQKRVCATYEWEHNLDRVSANRGTYQLMLDLSERILGNMITMTDSAYRLIAYTHNMATDDPLTLELIRNGFHGERAIAVFRKNGLFSQWTAQKKTRYTPNAYTKHPIMNYVFTVNGAYFIQMVMTCNTVPYSQGLLDTFNILVAHIKAHIRRISESDGNSYSQGTQFLSDLISGKHVPERVISQQLRSLGMSGKEVSRLYAIQNAGDNSENLEFVAHQISAKMPSCFAITKENYVYLIACAHDNQDGTWHMVEQTLLNSLDLAYVNVAVSGVFEKLQDIHWGVQQTEIAFRYSKGRPYLAHDRLDREDPFFRFENGLFDYLLFSEERDLDFLRFCLDTSVLAHIDQDRQKHPTDTEVLRCYLKHECSVSVTAEALGVHRNTVLNRISALGETEGIDFDDPKVRINLTTLFHLADLLDRHTEG